MNSGSCERLRAAGIEDAEANLQWMLAEQRADMLEEWTRRRVAREPLQYILGYTEFYGCRINVDQRVLIPRPETEELVEAVLKRTSKEKKIQILEIGTGSGCIAIALAKELPSATIVATDISSDALLLARENAKMNAVEDRITFVATDLFPPLTKFDLIISNPPYISSSIIPTLMPEVKDWEPIMALDGGPDGLGVIRKIIAQAPRHLVSNGWLMLEIGDDQGPAVRGLLQKTGDQGIEIKKDLSGRDRIAIACRGL